MIRRRRILALATLAGLAWVITTGCSNKVAAPGVVLTPRTFYMGFSAIAPRPDINVIIQGIQMWQSRADAAIMHEGPPWDSLLAGVPAETLVVREKLPLAEFYRQFGLKIVMMIDATDGLNRSADAPELVAAGRSLTEPEVQQVFRRYCVVMDSILRPDYMGLIAETNLIRAAAPAPLYAAVVQAANGAATDIRAFDTTTPLYISVQVETAWGALGGPGVYQGIAQDVADFPFMNVLGLSSYPYFSQPDPDSLPGDYYSRLANESGLSVMVVEGGWTSASVGGITSSPQKQERYIAKQAALLDSARAMGVFQLTFTDLDTTALGLPPGSILPLFAAAGLVDVNFVAKPSLSAWDAMFARPKQ